jgi:hypothetical protein
MTRSLSGLLTFIAVVALAGVLPSSAAPQQHDPRTPDPRPRPYPVFETGAFRRAVERGTRTRSGRPGPAYWTNFADYRIDASLDPASRTLTGRAVIRYRNRSPDALPHVVLHLHQNLFLPGALRSRAVPVTSGMRIARVQAGGTRLAERREGRTGAGFEVDGTLMTLYPPEPVPAGGAIEMELDWSFTVTPDGAPRGGTDGAVFFVSYWYPQVAVYDDIGGWNTDGYQGNAEFYMGYGDYDVAITVPAGWLIGSTGELVNADEVLSARTREKLARARSTRETVHVIAADERGAGNGTAAGANGRLTWRFRAQNVRDFDFGVSDRYVWDATAALAGDANGDGRPDTVAIHTLYRPERVAWAWDRSAPFEQHSIEFLSAFLWPYRYPQMTAIDGPRSCAGMEYPMITCIGGQRDSVSLYSVLVHETAHMWFPMMVGSNETRHSWQDEGLTRFNQAEAMADRFRGMDPWPATLEGYAELAEADGEVELMRHGDLYPRGTAAFGMASYDKMALILRALRGLLGEETFLRAYREYGRRWLGAHPAPYDFFNTFNDVSGQDLWWFWRTWFFETWTLDQAVTQVAAAADQAEITIEDRGLAPMPVRIAVTRSDGSVDRYEVPVEVWLTGARRHVLRVPRGDTVMRVEIDPERRFPDVAPGNNLWTR